MKETLKPGLTSTLKFRVPDTKTVPELFPESLEFQAMPRVFATGYMVGLVEWACMTLINAHLDWPKEQTVGTDVALTHQAPTPPGLVVTVTCTLAQVERRKLLFSIRANDGVDEISWGTHERHVIETERFNAKVARKAS
jgi:fluoroacetyl-CoA thioesterase